ncbi:peptidase domain containing protein [Methylobacterium sp. Leaf104]|uniref:DUF882 domain-containing protein n=1 Tax=Methylobacterium TaxID=407 RepID=UPI0006F70FD2|nr:MULTISPECIES: DUF882 domain-containing protein [Methylobacterium]KQP36400.1 peptidase domain containing protein [Methylobacterium sp. Leaf104]MCI9878419.1 DUF882 domain-containing protein [Methylobacterium goesingense]
MRLSVPKRTGRLAVIAASFGLALVGGTRGTQDAVANGDTRTISIYHTHTKESLTVTFKRDGRYDRAALEQLNWLLRDWRADEPTKMDPRLFDTVWEAYRSVGSQQPINVVSAYRSPGTNAMLRRRSRMVAEYSQHMLGKAMDFHLPDVSIDQIRAVGMRMQRGGVGWYPRSGTPFVHLDVGSVRSWPRMTHDQLARLFPDGKTVHLPSDNRPLPGYELARAEILSRGGTVLGVTEVAQMDEDDGPSIKGFFASLFGGGRAQESAPPVQAAAKAPERTRAKPAPVLVASADPEDAVGARAALAYAAPATDEALKGNLLRRDGRNAQSLLTGEAPAEAATLASEPVASIALPLPPRRPSEFAAVTAALTMPLPPQRPAVQVAGLGNAGMANLPPTPVAARPALVPANAEPRLQLRALFVAAAADAEPASRAAPVRLATAKAKLDGAPTAIVMPPAGVATRFSARSPGDDLAASRFSSSATRTVPGAR